MATSAALAVMAVVSGVSAGASANQASIANKRAKNAAAQARRAQGEQTVALEELAAAEEAQIPRADSDATKRRRRRSIAGQLGRRGRQSTILTDQGQRGTLGV